MKFFRLWLLSSLSPLLLPVAVLAKPVTCMVMQQGTIQFSGSCLFRQDGGNGSFSIMNATGGQIVPGVTQLSVYVMSGLAEVRGLTVDGINSRWGPATRNSMNPACWDGSDFQICAY